MEALSIFLFFFWHGFLFADERFLILLFDTPDLDLSPLPVALVYFILLFTKHFNYLEERDNQGFTVQCFERKHQVVGSTLKFQSDPDLLL